MIGSKMKTVVHLCMLIALVPLGALNAGRYDITRRESRCESDTHTCQTEVYIVSCKEWTKVVSHVATLDGATGVLINQSYQGYTVSTTANENSSVTEPQVCFAKLKKQWEKRTRKSSLVEIFRRKAT